ncbi:MAG: hypothetical protein KC503_18645, partial [Myxococcales bacterium]|nr:hypothetical protein [Myxococcales bacterium]
AASAGSDAASAAAPAPAPTLRLALKYARSGKRGAALAVLRALQAKNPKAHYASYLAGKLYFETRAYAAGIRAYRRAILDRRYRRLPRVTRDAIRALGSSAYNQATTLLMRVGRPALPQLRRAARHHKNRRVRARARWLTRYITRHRRRPRRRKRRGRRRRRRKRRR